jgi:hypothetical protein
MEKKRKNTKQANRKVYDKRQELIAFYESQGASPESVDNVLQNYQKAVEAGITEEWVDKEGFKKFFGLKNNFYVDRLFDLFKQPAIFRYAQILNFFSLILV